MKHLHKFFNKEDVPWVKLVWNYYPDGVPQVSKLCGSFWWRDIMKLVPTYRSFCSVKVQAGDTAVFWSDEWNGKIMQKEFLRLHSFALDTNLSVKEVVGTFDRTQLFFLPLSHQAFSEFQAMELVLSQVQLNDTGRDCWTTVWKDGTYSSSLYYKHCFREVVASPIYAWIWKSKVLLRIKVFAWLMVSDRLNTREMIKRRNWKLEGTDHCVLCPTQTTETWMHLFFHCNFSVRVWTYLQIEWEPGDSFHQVFDAARRKFGKPFFAEVVILACWHIWKQRNEAIFQKVMPSFRGWRARFIHEATLHKHRVRSKVLKDWSIWIDSLL